MNYESYIYVILTIDSIIRNIFVVYFTTLPGSQDYTASNGSEIHTYE